MVRTLPLTRGLTAVIDDEDWDRVNERKWHVVGSGRNIYAASNRGRLLLHKFLLGVGPGLEVDHINGNRFDCRRSNLRVASHAENVRNVRVRKDSRTGFKGVRRSPTVSDRWCARIRADGRRLHLGSYGTAEEAARAYDAAARKLFGAFGRFNFPDIGEESAK